MQYAVVGVRAICFWGGGVTRFPHDWLTSSIWVPRHFRDPRKRHREAVLRAGLLLITLLTAHLYVLPGQPIALLALFGLLNALLFWSIPTSLALYTGVWVVFTLARGYSDDVGFPDQGARVLALDRWLGFGQTLTERLQQALYQAGSHRLLDRAAIGIHLSYFVVPHLVALALWWLARGGGRPHVFSRYLCSVVLTMAIGLIAFVLIPAAPPWLQADRKPQSGPGVYRVVNGSLHPNPKDQANAVYSVVADQNPVAAMPSLHMAISVLVACTLWSRKRTLGVIGAIYALSMGFALVYLGEHYLVDVAAGSALALIAVALARRIVSDADHRLVVELPRARRVNWPATEPADN